MRWWVEVSREARSNIRDIKHSREDAKSISQHLAQLAEQATPGESLRLLTGVELRYTSVGRFRVVFKLKPSEIQPPGTLVVISVTVLA